MSHRFIAALSALAGVMAGVSLAPVPLAGPTSPGRFVGVAEVSGEGAQAPATGAQDAARAADTWTPPRTPWGEPDLQGIWDFRTITPLERPTDLAGKNVFTDEEAAEFEKRTLETSNADNREATPRGVNNGAPTTADVERAYNNFWYDRGTKVIGTKRTSLIVDPADGRTPPLTPDGQKRMGERAAARERPAHGPED